MPISARMSWNDCRTNTTNGANRLKKKHISTSDDQYEGYQQQGYQIKPDALIT